MLWIKLSIYLRSPNRGLALFSLAVAFFLDIAAFTVGFLIYLVEEKNKKEQLLRGLSTQRDRGMQRRIPASESSPRPPRGGTCI
ncbi:MAG: hypothetical protein ACLRNQ_25325 [Flavonifractor plautii]